MENYLYQDLFLLEEHHWWHKAKRQLVLDAIRRFSPAPSKKKLTLLDIGCGTGKNMEEFQKFADAYGVDISPEALKFCRQRGLKQVKLVDVEGTLPFASNTFDMVTMLDVLEHIEESPSLKEIYRVLKPGGMLYVSVPAFQWLWSGWDEVLHHKRRYTSQSLTTILKEHHFHLTYLSYVYSFLVVPVWIVRKLKSNSRSQKYESDFKLGSPLINTILGKVAAFERRLLWSLPLPFGTSVFASAQKEKNG